MKRRNNKGFSLIELIIAVAVMALLITPIIVQLAHTLETSAQAKEKQYADENAEYVMEYFRKTEKNVLDKGGSVDGQLNISNVSEWKVENSTGVECDLYLEGNSAVQDTISYDVTDYTLDDVKLGKKNNTYTRTVSLDDLANRVMASSNQNLRISYDVTKDTLPEGFTLLNDGSAVQYDENGHVNAIVCKPSTGDYEDPNETNLGNIQDLDSSKMAIIEGDAASLDNQYEADLLSLVTDIDTRNGITEAETINSDIQGITNNSPIYRTAIIITSGIVDQATNELVGYNVKVRILYVCNTEHRGESIPNKSYTIYDKDFNTTEAPDVYYIFEPYVMAKSSGIASYSSDEFIIVSADRYTNGEDGKDPSKIYLVKPDKTWFSTKGISIEGANDDTSFWDTVYGSATRVQIQVCQNYATSPDYPLKIYTNIQVDPDTGEWIEGGTCFNTAALDVNGGHAGAAVLSAVNEMNVLPHQYMTGYSVEGVPQVFPLRQDPRYAGRLYSITVTLKDPKGRTTHYKGTKGAD
jgi:prepilin-type N-terminal cleavage/methylation domain-containing protein